MDQAVADAVRASVLGIVDDEDAVQEALVAAWRVLAHGGPLKLACRAARVAAEQYVAVERARSRWEVPAGLLV
jgi:DNA-directed RNA polymerase specialized sigma24 family protein